jgi:antirestriction protein ArdC
MENSSSAKRSAYQQAADSLVAQLEAGVVPWRKPWTTSLPKNLVSQKEYRGMNLFLLALSGYPSPYWLTFKQAGDLGGGYVMKGEHGTHIFKFSVYDRKRKDENNEDTLERGMYWKSYTVFNITQCNPELAESLGLNAPAGPTEDLPAAQAIWDNYPNRPELKDSDHAFYRPPDDLIGMPPVCKFKKTREYYSTLFHEMVHSTGSNKRLCREFGKGMGSEKYSTEELVAEFGSAMLCGVTGIQPEVVENQAAYIATWLQVLKASDNKKAITQAISAAQKACDLIRGVKAEQEPLKEMVNQ